MRTLISLLPALLLAAAGASRAAEPGPTVPPPRTELTRVLPKLVPEALPPGAAILPRHGTKLRRHLRYEGFRREQVLVRAAGRPVPVSSRTYRVRRTDLFEPADAGLARAWFHSEDELIAAREAGRDRRAALRARPSGGRRLAALRRRFSPRGAEPAAGDGTLRLRLSPVPELPRLPAGRLAAGSPVARAAEDYLITWRLAGAARLGRKKCWIAVREVKLPPRAPRGAPIIDARAEYLLDAKDFTVLALVERWAVQSGNTVRESLHELRLTRSGPVTGKDMQEAIAQVLEVRELLRAIDARDVARAERVAEKARAAGYRGPALKLAARFAAAEKELAAAKGGGRRIDLVPEDSYVFLAAPRRLKKGAELTPVVFLHGAAADAETYFRDWKRHAGRRPLLLIFPQARDWTWNARNDGAMLGSLLEVLGRTYKLRRDRLVLAGHAAGAETAFMLGYGAEFPRYRLRGVVAAGGVADERIRARAFKQRPPELVRRLRATDVLLLVGRSDKKVTSTAVKNCARWLATWNPEGISVQISPEVGHRYSADWTPQILKWIGELGPPRAAAGKKKGR